MQKTHSSTRKFSFPKTVLDFPHLILEILSLDVILINDNVLYVILQ